MSSSGLIGVAPIDGAVSLTHGFASRIRNCPAGALQRMPIWDLDGVPSLPCDGLPGGRQSG